MKTISLLGLLLVPFFAFGAESDVQAFFQSHCVKCHGEKKQKGKVRLDDPSRFDAELWTAIYDQLANQEMPPDDEPQPDAAEVEMMKKHVLALATEDQPATDPGFRRLNKREYGYTVRDLLGLKKGIFDPGESIYNEEVDEGFDTRARALIISNEMLLEYMGAAQKSLGHALFTDQTAKPDSETVQVKMNAMKGDGGSRYINNSKDHIIMRNGGRGEIYAGRKNRSMEGPGRYKITVTASAVDRDFYPIRFAPAQGPLVMGFGVAPHSGNSLSSQGTVHQTFQLKDEVEQTFEIESWIDRGHYPYFSFVNGPSKPITQIRANIRRGKLDKSFARKPFRGPGIKISALKIEGPFHDEWPPQSIKTTYDLDRIPDIKDPAMRAATVRRFATRAFRRYVSAEELEPYFAYLDEQFVETNDWHTSTVRTFAAMMASVDFLYLNEGQGELDAYALANRLSYFLTSSMPDGQLFALAKSGQIKDEEVFRSQVLRLLNDPRSRRFTDSFADQWLSLDTLGSMPPDGKNPAFREYYRANLESAMLEETRLFFSHLLKENRSVREFINSDYSFVNRGLASLYGIPFTGGNDLVKVSLPKNSNRGGLLGHASILTLTSNGVETSPVTRGHWVLDEFLGTPPPPAPKEVPALVPDLRGLLTVRDQLEKHRSDAACMECHRRMDPPGLALESFDPIGRFRTRYSKTQKVTTDSNFLGQDFADVNGLKDILLAQLRPFSRNLIIKIAEYAKGRELNLADFETVEAILERASQNDFRLHDMIVDLATSELMTHR
ncbi:MAG: DUF1592 domain-containing protein [Verrucomicrobiales bacterium]|nr:DUF1592 domain-containing protein [Verrucomicrobiales bacterium]